MDNNTDNPTTRQPRITPRNSDMDEAIAAAAAKDTPWRTLNQLANIPRTPLRRASSVGPPSTHRSNRRTPVARTPGAAQKLGSAKRTIAVTPHGRAAQRELDLRRAGLTPGKDRRRSGRQQRETPRDALRALSRLMAPKSQLIVPTPQGPNAPNVKLPITDQDDWEDGPDPERPRLSLPLGDDEDEDDSLLLPPRSAGLENENFTVQSIELGRRAHSEQPLSRHSRGSFGSIRMSDAFADLNDLGLDGLGDIYDSSVLVEGGFGGDGSPFMGDDTPQRETTGTLRGLELDRDRISLASGRDSDIRPAIVPGDDTETTFVFNVPPRDVSEEPQFQSDDVSDSPTEAFTQEEEDNDEDTVNGINTEGPEVNIIPELEGDINMQDTTIQGVDASIVEKRRIIRKKVKISKHGIQYPSFPAGVVKKLATTFARTAGNSKAKISKETLDAIMQASDWFFEQVSDDLGAYAKHAGRQKIDESDIVTLMARQRQTNATTTPFSLAQKYLPRELLQELRMVPPSRLKKGRQLQRVDEAEED